MRSLSSALTAAQKSPSSVPYPKVEIFDKVGGITRFNWERLYEGEELDSFHAAAMPSNGSLIRLRTDPSDNKLYRQRVTSPAPGSDFSIWTDWGVTSYAVALCAYGAAVFAFRVGLDGHLYRCESMDSGASWGSWTDMDDISGTSDTALACCFKNASSAIVLYSQNNGVYSRRLSGGAWEAAAAWTNSVDSITGLAVVYSGDWNVVVTGTATTSLKPHVWTCVYGDAYSEAAGIWSSLEVLTYADYNSGVSFGLPSIAIPDVFRIFFLEAYSAIESYCRPYWTYNPPSQDFINNLWREPVPFNLSSNYGLAIAHQSSYVWLTRPDGVWRTPLAAASVEVTSDILLLTTDIAETSGQIVITLRNDDGRYAGPPSPVKLGSEVCFSPGYHTPEGVKVSSGLRFWITGWEYISHPPSSVLCLHAADGWSLLERWRARRQFQWAADEKNIFQLLNFIFARAGLEFSSFSYSSAIVDQYPAFTIHPGESGRYAVLRLLSKVPDVLFFRGEHGYIINPQDSDTSVYSYGSGTTIHSIYEGKYTVNAKKANRVQVFGQGGED